MTRPKDSWPVMTPGPEECPLFYLTELECKTPREGQHGVNGEVGEGRKETEAMSKQGHEAERK